MILSKQLEVTVGARNLKTVQKLVPTVSIKDRVHINQIDAYEYNIGCNIIKLECMCELCYELYNQSVERLIQKEERVHYCGKCLHKIASMKMKKTQSTPAFRKKRSEQVKAFYQTEEGKLLKKEVGKRCSEFLKNNPEKWKHLESVKRNTGPDHHNWNPNKTEFQKYANKVRLLTEKTYENYKHILNPNRLERVLLGQDGYQLDHIISVKKCFDLGFTEEFCSSLNNLQVLSTRINRLKWA